MSQKFKKGDTITAVDVTGAFRLTKGKIYTALSDDKDGLVRICNDCGYEEDCFPQRFTLHTPKQSTMIPENMEPFDLETALKEPDRVCTRDGRSVKIAGYNPDAISTERIVGWLECSMRAWSEDGKYLIETDPSVCDLFLRAKEVVKYVIVYKNGHTHVNNPFNSLARAREYTSKDNMDILAITYRGEGITSVQVLNKFNQ